MATISGVTNNIIDRYNDKKKGWTNSDGYQCVALMQYFLNQFEFKDGWLASAWLYGQAFKNGFKDKKTVMGLNPYEWKIVTKDFKKGDVLFYKPTLTNKHGHVAIAISSTKRLEQNMVSPYDGSYQYITSNSIGKPAYALRKAVSPTHIGKYLNKYLNRIIKFNIYAKDKMEKLTTDRGSEYRITINTSSSRVTRYNSNNKIIKGNNLKNGQKVICKIKKI